MVGHLMRPLRRQKQKRRCCNLRGHIPDRRSITTQPGSIELRSYIRKWEGDTAIVASQQNAIVTLIDRKSSHAVVTKLSRKTSDQVSTTIVKRLKLLAWRVRTITYHDGKEFVGQKAIVSP
jgi:IS30 family transposase